MNGIILAGGAGSRPEQLTLVASEQFELLIARMPDCEYRDYVRYVLAEVSRGHRT